MWKKFRIDELYLAVSIKKFQVTHSFFVSRTPIVLGSKDSGLREFETAPVDITSQYSPNMLDGNTEKLGIFLEVNKKIFILFSTKLLVFFNVFECSESSNGGE
jgi:hypothetical protein